MVFCAIDVDQHSLAGLLEIQIMSCLYVAEAELSTDLFSPASRSQDLRALRHIQDSDKLPRLLELRPKGRRASFPLQWLVSDYRMA